MIKSINFLGKPEAPGTLSNVASAKPVEAPKTEPAKDTFVQSTPKQEDAPKADPNDKFEKSEEKKSEEKDD